MILEGLVFSFGKESELELIYPLSSWITSSHASADYDEESDVAFRYAPASVRLKMRNLSNGGSALKAQAKNQQSTSSHPSSQNQNQHQHQHQHQHQERQDRDNYEKSLELQRSQSQPATPLPAPTPNFKANLTLPSISSLTSSTSFGSSISPASSSSLSSHFIASPRIELPGSTSYSSSAAPLNNGILVRRTSMSGAPSSTPKYSAAISPSTSSNRSMDLPGQSPRPSGAIFSNSSFQQNLLAESARNASKEFKSQVQSEPTSHPPNASNEEGVDSKGQTAHKYKKRSRAPPPGACQACGCESTPEWRRGPDGSRTLCNACE